MTDTALVDPVDGTDTLVGVTVGAAHCAKAARASTVNRRTARRPQYFMKPKTKMTDSPGGTCISRALKKGEIAGLSGG
jgi:hypothetical protein